jgi:phosphomannomutase
MGVIPPTSGPNAVFCSEWANWMPHYHLQLKHALMKQVHGDLKNPGALKQTLKGLKIVLNAGNGSGGFFKQVLKDLGADVEASIHTQPDPNFPAGVPNPENESMIQETIKACDAANADLGIMLDTDADRCGMVVPRTIGVDGSCTDYEPLNRNRLIALMGVIFARESPGCAIVTDSVTSNGLATFLQDNLGLVHVT